jgi:hypothetical protein
MNSAVAKIRYKTNFELRTQKKRSQAGMALTQAKTLMHPESDYGRMIGGCFANASAASPPAVYFAKQPTIIHLLPTRMNVMGLIA